MSTKSINILTGDYTKTDLDKTILDRFQNYKFEPDHFQKHAIERIQKNQHILTCVPTGSGKTLVAMEGIHKALSKGKKVIYTSPIKTLSNQKFSEFTKIYPDTSVGILTGDIKLNPNADILIMTTEILRNLLYYSKMDPSKKTSSDKLGCDIDLETQLDVVIYDEVHYINDKDRGKVWEESLIMMPKQVQLILLSATISHPEVFAGWIQSIANRQVNLIEYHKRPVPLEHFMWVNFGKISTTDKELVKRVSYFNKNLVPILSKDGEYNHENVSKFNRTWSDFLRSIRRKYVPAKSIFVPLVEMLAEKKLTPALFFCLSRKKCEKWASYIQTSLNTPDESRQVSNIVMKSIYKLDNPEYYKRLNDFNKWKSLWEKGVAVHHSGMIPVFKEIVEQLFAAKLIKLLFATETFAVGVNMPTKTVLFSGLTKYSESGFRLLETHEYLQMSGRAGRRGLDPKGVVILLPNLFDMPESLDLKMMMLGQNQTITSKFTLNHNFVLKAVLSGKLREIVSASMLSSEIEVRRKEVAGIIESDSLAEPLFKSKVSNLKELYNLENPSEFVKFTKKQRVKNSNRIKFLKGDKHLVKDYELYCNWKKRCAKHESLVKELKYYETVVEDELEKELDFLLTHGYITNFKEQEISRDNMWDLTVENITVKGIVASNIHEINPIIMTELLVNDVFADITPQELIAILAVFLETRSINDSYEKPDISSIGLSRNCVDIIYNILDTANYFGESEYNKFKLDLGTQYEIFDTMIPIAFDWANGVDFREMIRKMPIFEGNFIKDMIKINNILMEIESASEIIENIKLYQLCQEAKSLIIRDVVSIDSLYLKEGL